VSRVFLPAAAPVAAATRNDVDDRAILSIEHFQTEPYGQPEPNP
jgi:hypothetical protein